MKKLITLAVALVCVLTLSISAFATTAWDGGEWLRGDNCYANTVSGTAEGLNILSVELPSDHDILITFDKDLKDVDLSSLEVRYYIYTIEGDVVYRPFFMCANGGSNTFINQPAFVTAIASVVDGKLAIDLKDPTKVAKMGTAEDNKVLADFADFLNYVGDNENNVTVGLRIKKPSGSGDFVGLIEGTDGTGLAKTVDDGGVCAFLPLSDYIEAIPDKPITPNNPNTGDTTIAAIACVAVASAAALAFVSTTRKKEH